MENPETSRSSQVLELASEAGQILLENGSEISRVDETMKRIAANYGESSENFFTMGNGIITTGDSYAGVKYIPIKGARFDKIIAVNQLSWDIQNAGCTFDEALERIASIRTMRGKPVWEQLIGAALGSGGFCAVFGGSLFDCAAAVVAGILLWIFVLTVSVPYLSKMLGNIFGGLVGTALCAAFHSFGFGEHLGNMIAGTLILLVPGVAFTNGIRDLANEDYLSGATRLMDALMMFFCIALGTCVAFVIHSYFIGGIIQLNGTFASAQTSGLPAQSLAALMGTLAFAILFSVPRKFYLSTGLVGMLGWITYLLIYRYAQLGIGAATFAGAFVVALLSIVLSIGQKCPSTIFLVCGNFPLIPGGGIFWSTYYTLTEQLTPALTAWYTALKVAVAIVLGMIIVTWYFQKRKSRKGRHA